MKLKTIALLLFACASLQATTFTGKLEDIGQNSASGWALRLSLRGCSPASGQPYIPRNSTDVSTAIIPTTPLYPDATGAITATVPDETTISCGSTTSSVYYHIDAVHIKDR